YDVIVVDCLTLWINNLMLEALEKGQDLDEAGIVEKCELLGVASSQGDNTVIFVTNEVGAGIVPDNESARAFRDLAGRCNQKIAAMADGVIMMVSGLPLILKGQKL
ncbi:MAG: bifunctional adenosylcobinamide kinase/adenosylcobinamide-phosphate guanylyltransferase, partial [Actinomycetia bacterium]|nr:bifunctional adenosylcobinamide kinase/adenosylcobinamide-phosphate guanylyltransferase [Actinomycetes bacterium]